jgi:hypothetical protein
VDDQMSPNDRSGDVDVGGSLGDRDRNGRTRGGRVNTSAWLIGALLVVVAVFAGLRFARVPAPPSPAPTRPAPTVPAPSPTPAPTTPAPTTTDLDRSITKVEDAVTRKDWSAATRELSVLRTAWEGLRGRITSQDTMKDTSMFEASLKKLEGNIREKNEAGAKDDIKELKTIAKKFKLAPTGGPTSG